MKTKLVFQLISTIIISIVILILAFNGSFRGKDTFPIIYGAIVTIFIGSLIYKNGQYRKHKLLFLAMLGVVAAWSVSYGHSRHHQKQVDSIITGALENLETEIVTPLAFDRQLSGDEISNPYDFSSSAFTVLNFWATWCKPCIKEMPLINGFYDNCEDTEVIGIIHFDNKGQESKAKKMIEELNIRYPIVEDLSKKIIQDYRISRWPTTVLIDREGKVLDYAIGIMGTSKMLAEIEEPCR